VLCPRNSELARNSNWTEAVSFPSMPASMRKLTQCIRHAIFRRWAWVLSRTWSDIGERYPSIMVGGLGGAAFFLAMMMAISNPPTGRVHRVGGFLLAGLILVSVGAVLWRSGSRLLYAGVVLCGTHVFTTGVFIFLLVSVGAGSVLTELGSQYDPQPFLITFAALLGLGVVLILAGRRRRG